MGVTTFNEMEIDAIGEIMNISLGASATAVSTMLGTAVHITKYRSLVCKFGKRGIIRRYSVRLDISSAVVCVDVDKIHFVLPIINFSLQVSSQIQSGRSSLFYSI